MAKVPKTRLTWFLIKSSIDSEDASAIIEQPDELHAYRLPALDPDRDLLYLKASPPKRPKWLGYVEPHIGSGDLPGVLGAAASGALLIPIKKQLLVVAFGHGRFLIRPDAILQNFGLRVVLNTVEHTQLKSVDARSFDELTVHTRRGVSRDSALPAFDLDVSRNILRGLTGTASDGDLEGALSGTDSLAMTSAVTLPGLPELGRALLKAYSSKRYQKHFAFIDQVRAERGPAMVDRLNKRLVKALDDGDLDNAHLAIPEPIDWQRVEGVRFSFRKKDHSLQPDPKISTYRMLRGADHDVKKLKTDKVEAVDSADEAQLVGRWSVYNCVVFETAVEGTVYVLSGGDWYRVSKAYREKVEAYVETLPVLSVGLPEASAGESEADYNETASAAIGALHVDRSLIGVGGRDRVELCDVLTEDGTFIHVKKRGRSSTLSHLFAQGVTSAELLLQDEEFLQAAANLVTQLDSKFSKAIPTQTGARDHVKVAYVFLSRARGASPLGLPFFSLVSLQAAAQRLRAAGLEVLVQEVKEVDQGPAAGQV